MKRLTIVICIGLTATIAIPAFSTAISVAFAEVATASYCPDCPPSNEILFDIYQSHEYPFYYVEMVGDKNEFAYNRIKNDYNFYWYPTAFFDGGYRVVLASDGEEYKNAIEDCLNRDKPGILIEVNAEWIQCPCQHGLDIDIYIENNDEKKYNGFLKVYVVEINSRWDDYSANQYHFSFLEFAYLENVSILPDEKIFLDITWDPTINFPDIDIDDANNLAVIGVLFNSTWHTNYANPPDKNPFKAYYVDAVSAYIPENSPPSISIISPKDGYLYIFDREIIKFHRTVIIGKKTVDINAFDESGIEKVEIYVDGELKATLKDNFKWTWKDFGSHSLYAVAYDNFGLNATDSVSAFIMA
ncbi:MAG TPA: hypothetical protein ENI33_05020 [Thermoplasmatales archaeon]|nr:hypothetical protein [Thermoplasmatales archaeon]